MHFTCRQFQQYFWILLGTLSNFCTYKTRQDVFKHWDPLLEAFSSAVTDRIELILAYHQTVSQSANHYEKNSLFYVFAFVQAWTIYGEIVELVKQKNMNVSGLWIKITPAILALMSQHGDTVSDIVISHLLSTLESLQCFNSSTYLTLHSLWASMLRFSFPNGHTIQQRLSNLDKNMCRSLKKDNNGDQFERMQKTVAQVLKRVKGKCDKVNCTDPETVNTYII